MMCGMATGLAARRKRLGTTITALRRQRRLTVEAAAAKAGMSSTTWQRVEDGLGVRSLTYRGVEEVFGFRWGILDELLAGTADWDELAGAPSGESRTMPVDDLTEDEIAALENMRDLFRRKRHRNAS